MQEEEVVVVPEAFGRLNLICKSLAGIDHVHADQLGQPAIHGIDSDGDGAKAVDLFHRLDVRELGETTHHQKVGRRLVFEDLFRLTQKFSRNLGRFFAG